LTFYGFIKFEPLSESAKNKKGQVLAAADNLKHRIMLQTVYGAGLTGIDISCCLACKKGKMIRIRKLPIQNVLN